MQRLRPLSEAECYARCYAAKSDTVRVVKLEPRRPRFEPHVSGEQLRQHFETLLESREPDELPPHSRKAQALSDVEPEAA